MNGINKAIILGRVGADPKVTVFQNGGKCAQFTLATTERGFRTNDGREVPERTEWHNIVCYGNFVSVVQDYVRKGSAIYVEGKIRTRKYEDQNHIDRYVTEIFIDQLQLLDRKQDSTQGASQQQQATSGSTQQTQTQQGQGNVSQAQRTEKFPPEVDARGNPVASGGTADDLPF